MTRRYRNRGMVGEEAHPIVLGVAVAMQVRRLSTRVVAKRAGLARQTVRDLLNGKSKPTIAVLDRLASAVGLVLRIELETASDESQVLTVKYARPRAGEH